MMWWILIFTTKNTAAMANLKQKTSRVLAYRKRLSGWESYTGDD